MRNSLRTILMLLFLICLTSSASSLPNDTSSQVADAIEGAPLDAIGSLGRIDDLRPGQGPLGGIEALLASELDDRYLVCPCDLPLITSRLLGVLAADCPTPAAVFRIDGETRCRPLPLQITSAALGPLRELLNGGCRAVYRLLERIETTVIPAPRDWARLLRPLNTPRDYDQILNPSAR